MFSATGLIFTVLIIIECTSGFYIRVRVVIIYFYIRCYHVCISDSVYSFYYFIFSFSHLYDSGYLFLHIYHSLPRAIHICTYVSLAT